MSKSIYEIQMAAILKNAGYKFKEEVKFHPSRKWRFDFVLEPVKTKIAIEVSGGHFIPQGRHTYGKGYEKDLEKINTAQLMGWIVLQYTGNTLSNILQDLKMLGKN